MERPRMFLLTKEEVAEEYSELLVAEISRDCLGISYFVLSIDPDPNALYQILVGKALAVVDTELTAIWTLALPHLDSGVYDGFRAGDKIVVRHKSAATGVSIKTSVCMEYNEVIRPAFRG